MRVASLPPAPFCNVESVCPKRRQIKHVTAIRINFAHWGKGGKRGLYLSFAGGGTARLCLGKWFSKALWAPLAVAGSRRGSNCSWRARARSSGRNLASCCLYIAVLSVCSSTRLAQRWSLVCFVQKRYQRRESAQEIASKDFKLDPEFV